MLILASASEPRRKLLEISKIPFRVIPSKVNESKFKQVDAKRLVLLLAKAKAENVQHMLRVSKEHLGIYKDHHATLGCDSLFEFQGELVFHS